MSSQVDLPKFITLSQACALLDCHPNLIRTWESLGMISPVQVSESDENLYDKMKLLDILDKNDELEDRVLPSDFDLTRIDMTKTLYEKFAIDEVEKNIQDLVRETIDFFDFKKFRDAYIAKISYFEEKDFRVCKTLAEKILRIITSPKYRSGSLKVINLEKYANIFLSKLEHCIENNLPVEFMLPAMPFKIANPLKSMRRDADLAEVATFCKFNEINLQIKKIYKPGAKFTIFHDGQLYYRHFLHTKEDAERYYNTLNRFLKELEFEDVFEVRNAFEELKKFPNFDKTYEAARKEMQNFWNIDEDNKMNNDLKDVIGFLKENYHDGKIVKIMESAKQNINLADIPMKLLHKINFSDDWDLDEQEIKVKEEIIDRSTKCAFEYMVVQHALEKADFFNTLLPYGVRLTVHPKEGHIGVHMVKKKTHLLPWMGVGVLKKNGKVSVRYEGEVLSSGKFHPVYIKGEEHPFYYKEIETVHKGVEGYRNLFDKIARSLKKDDFYWAFSFNSEYHNKEIRNLLQDLHKKLAKKGIEDLLICSDYKFQAISQTFKDNKNIKILATSQEFPSGVIILKNKVVNLVWGVDPIAFEINNKEIIANYKEYFQQIWGSGV